MSTVRILLIVYCLVGFRKE